MQKLLLFASLFSILLITSCKKEETKKTTIEIVVRDSGGTKPNFTVYQMSDTKFNLYGADAFFKDQQSVTDNNGLATFLIDELDFTTGGQRTFYFFCNYTINGTSKSKNIGITLSEGDKKSGSLLLN